jgi:hypothetical protein
MKTRNLAVAAVASIVGLLIVASTAMAAPSFAPADRADIRPGVMTRTDGAQCTANFVFYDSSDVYLGQAAHCSGTDGSTATNGCDARSRPIGTEVEIEGASKHGKLAYNSWLTMQDRGEKNDNACEYNDFALVKVDPADVDEVNPTIPFFGGPTGIVDSTQQGDTVYSYGNSSLRFGAEALKPKEGKSLGQKGGGWSHDVYTVTPGIPGDSGSAFIDAAGRAFGTLSTVAIAPLPASNGVSDLSRELSYLESNTSFDVTLAEGTEPYRGGRLP